MPPTRRLLEGDSARRRVLLVDSQAMQGHSGDRARSQNRDEGPHENWRMSSDGPARDRSRPSATGNEIPLRRRALGGAEADSHGPSADFGQGPSGLGISSPEEIPAKYLGRLRKSRLHADRCSAVAAWSAKRPRAFLRAARRFLRDPAEDVRAAVMDGVATAGLLLQLSPSCLEVLEILDAGQGDQSSLVSRRASENHAVLDADLVEKSGREEALSGNEDLSIHRREAGVAILRALFPDLGDSVAELTRRVLACDRAPRTSPDDHPAGLPERGDLELRRFESAVPLSLLLAFAAKRVIESLGRGRRNFDGSSSVALVARSHELRSLLQRLDPSGDRHSAVLRALERTLLLPRP